MKAKFGFSTINDVTMDEKGNLIYTDATSKAARKYGMGLELAEFCISDNCDDDIAVRQHFLMNASSAPVLSLHAPYNELYPHAIDKRIARISWERYEAAYSLCLKMSIPKMIVHANYLETLYHPQWFIERQSEFWSRFLEEHEGNTLICLENMVEPRPSLLTEIVTRVNSPRLRICLDIGHANLSEVTPLEWFDRCGSLIAHMHLHNNNGPVRSGWPAVNDTHSPLGNGTIDINAILTPANRYLPDCTYAIECGAFDECALWLTERGYLN